MLRDISHLPQVVESLLPLASSPTPTLGSFLAFTFGDVCMVVMAVISVPSYQTLVDSLEANARKGPLQVMRGSSLSRQTSQSLFCNHIHVEYRDVPANRILYRDVPANRILWTHISWSIEATLRPCVFMFVNYSPKCPA